MMNILKNYTSDFYFNVWSSTPSDIFCNTVYPSLKERRLVLLLTITKTLITIIYTEHNKVNLLYEYTI